MPVRQRLFVLDTNVLIHDPSAVFRFLEHDIFIPMTVLEELDAATDGVLETARNAREACRLLDALIGDADRAAIRGGLPLSSPVDGSRERPPAGKLFLQTDAVQTSVPTATPGTTPAGSILATTLALQSHRPGTKITIVSKDINLRIKARVLGISAQDYYDDKVLDDVNLLYSGTREQAHDFWERLGVAPASDAQHGRARYAIPSQFLSDFYPNECLYSATHEEREIIARDDLGSQFIFEQAKNYRDARHAVWGITARNREQSFAMNMLMDPEIEFVSLLGAAGTGKTLLALSAGLAQSMETKIYCEIIVTRATVPVGDDIGFLPGTEEEKMTPWMGALLDNMEVLTHTEEGGDWGRAASTDLLRHRIKIRSLNFMRGRTFLNRYVIIDEAQNLTAKQMRTLITRAGPGSKIVCIGNIAQIDTPYLTETTSGLTYVIDRFKHWRHGGHVTLKRGERSRLADFASENL